MLIAAVAGYVHRVTGAPEVVLGLPVTGRTTAAQRAVPGHAVQRAAAAAGRRPGHAGASCSAAVGAEVRDVLAHSRFRAEELARELGVADGVAGLTGPTVNVIGYAPDLAFGDATATCTTLWPGPVSDLTGHRLRAAGRRRSWCDLDADAAVCGPDELATHEAGLLRRARRDHRPPRTRGCPTSTLVAGRAGAAAGRSAAAPRDDRGRDLAGGVRAAGARARRTRWRWCARTSADLRGAERGARTGWRGC